MGATNFTGPVVVTGPLSGISGALDRSADFGPSLSYQGAGLPDIRYGINKDNLLTGVVRAHYASPVIISVDAVPAALAANNLCGAQKATSGTALTLAAASAGISTGVPIQTAQNTVVTANAVMDFGFCTGNFTAASANVTVADSSMFTVGMPLVCANVGDSTGATALLTYVVSITSATVIVIHTPALATNPAANIGTGNMWGPDGLSGNIPTAAMPYIASGAGAYLDPAQAITRGWRVVSNNGADTGWSVTATGHDLYGNAQTETLAVTAGGTTWGAKTFKAFTSFVPTNTGSTTGTLSIGTSDVFGFAVRSERWEHATAFWAGALLTTSTGYTATDKTSPATASTGDVRGTLEIGANGPVGSGASGGASDGTLRLVLMSTLSPINALRGTQDDTTPVYGVTPV